MHMDYFYGLGTWEKKIFFSLTYHVVFSPIPIFCSKNFSLPETPPIRLNCGIVLLSHSSFEKPRLYKIIIMHT